MFRMYARNSHSYTHLILALGIVREPTVWRFITSEYPGIHDIGLAMDGVSSAQVSIRLWIMSVQYARRQATTPTRDTSCKWATLRPGLMD